MRQMHVLSGVLILTVVGTGSASTPPPNPEFQTMTATLGPTPRPQMPWLSPTEQALVVKLAELRHPLFHGRSPVADVDTMEALSRDITTCIDLTEDRYKAELMKTQTTWSALTLEQMQTRFNAMVFDCLARRGWRAP